MIVHVLATIRRWFDNRQAERQLSKLSDHMLSDIGISRGDISTVTRRGR
ncbi:DUF1127 domain-containing protein [Microvirga antarctica]|nr:DUF1127 domain-containing protein [Microvirga antarctica]